MSRWLILTGLLVSQAQAATNIDCDKVRDDDLMCLACNIYHESGNQSLDGKVAVGAVTINRVKSLYYPNSICEVVWQNSQFSWTNDGKTDFTPNSKWWVQAKDIAKGFMVATGKPHGAFNDPTQCALFYHADYVTPYWSYDKKMEKTTQIENHIFYRHIAMGCPTENVLAVSSNAPLSLNNN
ncbi:MAG: cell wall hydrolase [Bdellovibrionales bacterium]|nr:cell wall hydrolase [Bdellovibrionales bacterium]